MEINPVPYEGDNVETVATGVVLAYPFAILRMGMGHLCGYVGITEAHPLHGCTYSTRKPEFSKLIDGVKVADWPGALPYIPIFCQLEGEDYSLDVCIPVHGGITYGSKGNDNDLWWLGFDCAHAEDRDDPKDESYVREQVEVLARALHHADQILSEKEAR